MRLRAHFELETIPAVKLSAAADLDAVECHARMCTSRLKKFGLSNLSVEGLTRCLYSLYGSLSKYFQSASSDWSLLKLAMLFPASICYAADVP